MKPIINLKKLEIDSISNSSGIFHGENHLLNFKGYSIKNEGFGQVDGNDNTVSKTKSILIKNEKK